MLHFANYESNRPSAQKMSNLFVKMSTLRKLISTSLENLKKLSQI